MPFKLYEIRSQYSSELNQATLRVVIGLLALMYISTVALADGFTHPGYLAIAGYYLAFLVISLALRSHIQRKPGINPLRRYLAMLHDYLAISVGLAIGDEKTLPIYAVMVWVTLGYGVRYGTLYLLSATMMSVISLLVIVLVNDYWSSHRYMVLAFFLTTIVIPFYASNLLNKVKKASSQAMQATHSKAQLLAQVSHDLRQPVHAIGMYTTCLRDERLTDNELKLVENIDRALVSVTHIFHSMLDMYTLDSGGIKAKPETFHLANVIKDCLHTHQEKARIAGSDLKYSIDNCWIRTDIALLTIIINNLIDNAIKYGEGSPIRIRSYRQKEIITLIICDNGPGIEDTHMEQIFDEFFRIKKARDKDVEGIGLGLSIVKRACALAGLNIKLYSKVGFGTCAAIRGLMTVNAPVSVRQTVTTEYVQNTAKNVFLIEDNIEMMEATRVLLEKWGYHVLCLDPQNPLPLPPEGKCDVIVADYDLGTTITGIEYIQKIRKYKDQNIPALLITGHDIPSLPQQVKEINIKIVAKPIKPVELRSVLTEILS
ncbi:ATP-binding response regulator [Enterobacter roggenkampii]|uniref:ATP-binding response regulator n=1 Tax=Enterobacter roggenkampii TaxID=1812935 RepID=UPI000BA11E68|nr:hybrid sensor histidine kinase/response regulator [Enterobacter roggenkampii]OZU98599.1 hybrid sensor histidine kinase/response regulator [Enterobacter roggenkampii]WFC89305.1 hybrid sensor histidine kinase/response regulator [Enterobacter roggenkampii]